MTSLVHTSEAGVSAESVTPPLNVSPGVCAADELKGFSRSFIPDLRNQITSYLPGKDLKSYSLVCRAFHEDAAYHLWQSVQVRWTADQAFPDEFIRMMLKYPNRARHVKSFFLWYFDRPSLTALTPLKPALWLRFAQALSFMSNVVRLDIMVDWQIRNCRGLDQWAPQDLYDAFASAGFIKTLSYLSIDCPGDSRGFNELAHLFPHLRTLVCHDWIDRSTAYTHPGPSSLEHLQHVYGPPEMLSIFPVEASLKSFRLPVSSMFRIFHDMVRLGTSARRINSLEHLSFTVLTYHRADYSEDSMTLLTNLAHPNLRSLTVELTHSLQGPHPPEHLIRSPQFIFGFLAPYSLKHLPSLQHLHFTHLDAQMFQALVKTPLQSWTKTEFKPTPGFDEQEIQPLVEALEERLEAESRYPHSLQKLWIDCSQEQLLPTELVLRLRFSAERSASGGAWCVQAKMVWCSEAVDGQLGGDFTYVRRFWERRI
ncbi:hypothetical protein DL93DRAFT_2077937 [Clavulina sp. PMI_390]|nr:hypothetical protein DL93DRAFT_2077937 [Clavulina sp. PMI_390]